MIFTLAVPLIDSFGLMDWMRTSKSRGFVKIIEGANGLFVSMPSYKVGNEYKDICFPITQECRKQLNDAVIGAYEQALTQSQNSMAKHHEMQQAPEGQAMDMTGM